MISKENILKLETREKIYRLISKNPGMHFSEISRKLNIPKTTLLYHLNNLEKLDLIKQISKQGYKRIYISNKLSNRDKQLLGLLRQKIPCRIFLHLIFSFTCSRVELSKDLELHHDTIQYYLDKMMDLGIIEKAPVENNIIFAFSDDKRRAVVERKPVGREIFYRLKTNTGVLISTYKLMITHKNSLADKELIETFLEYYKNLNRLGAIGHHFRKDAKKKYIKKDGEKNAYLRISNIDEILDFVTDIFKPPFVA